MTAMPDITLYAALASRAFMVRWMLEELALPYRVRELDLRRKEQKAPWFLRINPMGKTPAITDGSVVVTEGPAICLYLADRYGYGTLAPAVDDPDRGPYLRWSVFATAVFEPAAYLGDKPDPAAASGLGWGERAAMLGAIDQAVQPGPWLLGERFSAADVALGSLISIALFNRRIEPTAALAAYDERLSVRPAYKIAAAANWPPALFGSK